MRSTRVPVLALLGMFAVVMTACGSAPQPSTPDEPPPGASVQGGGQGPDAAPCNFKVGEACFPDAASACTSAGCDIAACIQAESHPVQVSCP